jgi:predicted nuclease of predicted toxin-antitoxin system
MLRLLTDEHIPMRMVRGLLRREPRLDIVRVQDVGLEGHSDPQVLAWAAEENRILITFDVNTVPDAAYHRASEGQPMPGVFAIPWNVSWRQAIEDLLTLAVASLPDEWEGQIVFLPL